MRSDHAIWNGTSIFVGIIVAIAAFVRGALLLPLLLVACSVWGLYVLHHLRSSLPAVPKKKAKASRRTKFVVPDIEDEPLSDILLLHVNQRITAALRTAGSNITWEWAMCNQVTVKFRYSGIAPQGRLTMHFDRTSRPAVFHSSEAFVFDPAQYDDTANFQWHPSVSSDNVSINESDVTIYIINRKTFDKIKLFSCKFKDFNACLKQSIHHGSLKCSPEEIFLLNITQPKETFINAVHCQSTDESYSLSL